MNGVVPGPEPTAVNRTDNGTLMETEDVDTVVLGNTLKSRDISRLIMFTELGACLAFLIFSA